MAAAEAEKVVAPALPIPNFSDIGKSFNDLMNKDFYHTSQAALEIKLKAPSGTNITVKGKQDFNTVTTGSLEAKHVINKGVTATQLFTNGALSDTKLELADIAAPGVKIDLQNIAGLAQAKEEGGPPTTQKVNLVFKNANVHSRAFFTHTAKDGNVDTMVDVTVGDQGFLAGFEAGYNLQKAAITKYALAVGYQAPNYSASLTAQQSLQVISAGFYQRVNSSTEVGFKTGYDVQGAKATGIEVASKYKLDTLSFAKVKINDRGIAALAYNTKLNPGTTLGLGLSLDTAKLNEAGHKIGTSLTFEG